MEKDAQYSDLLSYDPDTGIIKWLVNRGRNAKPGQIAGRLTRNGHRHICVMQREVYAHRLAWFLVYGEWPSSDLDHVNGDPDDNRIANLRLATHTQNMTNAKAKKNSFTGLKGVSPHGRRWVARIRVDGVRQSLGRFDTKEEAAEAYRIAADSLHGEFARR